MKKDMLVVFALTFTMLFYFSTATAQTQDQVQIILGSASGAAGEEVSVSVELSSGPGQKIGELSFEIQFPQELLSFEQTQLAAGRRSCLDPQ